MRVTLLPVLLFLACACGREARTNPPPAVEANPTPPPPAEPAPDPLKTPPTATTPAPAASDPQAAKCNDIKQRFRDELAKKTDNCASAKDCACYGAEGGGCGGVTDSATAKRLEPISSEFHANKCRYDVLCAAWACAPQCNNGRCSR
jgi:hypothetical protein